MKHLSIGVIGAGAVGQAVAALLVTQPWCARLRITSARPAGAAGLVTDLQEMTQTTPGASRVQVEEAVVEDLVDCDALVLAPRATFTNTAAHDVRMAGIAANAPVIADLAARLAGFEGVAIMVTNPVDVLARHFAAHRPEARVWGIGSGTDTARYRLILAQHHQVPVHDVDGLVIGEHGDAMVICASTTTIAGRPAVVPLEYVRAQLAARPKRINAGIGRTRCGPAGATLAALRAALGVQDGTQILSTAVDGVWLGVPVHFTAGRPEIRMPALNTAETTALAAARAKLTAAYQQLTHPNQETLCAS